MKNVIQQLSHIVQEVSLASTYEQKVALMVESISEAMLVDVCSLYLLNKEGEMLLLATHGLAASAVRTVKLPAGAGLVGLVASTRHPVNIADAEKHPAYLYIAETQEERYHGFCAIPLVFGGRVIGVLVVQSSEKRQFSKNEEGFLVTLGAQLAVLLANYPISAEDMELSARVAGVKGSPGVAIGYSYLCDHGELYEVSDSPCLDIESTISEWHALVKWVSNQIDDEKRSLGKDVGEGVSGIFNAYKMLLNDPAFVAEVEHNIRDNNWLPGALKLAILHFSEVFLAMEDPYLQARHEDIHHLGNKLFNAWKGTRASTHEVDVDIVLVGQQVSISDIASVAANRLKGILCFGGSGLSHTAVLANSLGVPAVMGTGRIGGLIDGQLLIVDGDQAQVHISPNKVLLNEYRKIIRESKALTRQLRNLRQEPAETTDKQEIRLYTNTGLLTDISPGLNNGAQGVGLYRTEIPFLIRDSFPSEDEQVNVYRQVLEAYDGKPVFMRTLDIGGDKQLPYFPIQNEENPALGWRGIRFSLDNNQLLMTQVRAMLRASERSNNLQILLPMVTSIQEIEQFKEILDDACVQLGSEGYVIVKPRLGIMIEVPALIAQIPFLAGKVDFISIGSNDLSQYLLALDRNNARVASRYDHVHPGVLLEIKRILESAKVQNIPVSLCGEMAADPVAVVILLGMGMRTLSMSAAKLLYIKKLIRSISIAQAEEIADRALQLNHPDQIRKLVGDELKKLGLAELIR